MPRRVTIDGTKKTHIMPSRPMSVLGVYLYFLSAGGTLPAPMIALTVHVGGLACGDNSGGDDHEPD